MDHPVAATVGPDGRIYVTTSTVQRPANVSIYDVAANTWIDFTPLPIATYLSGSCTGNVTAAATTSALYLMSTCVGGTGATLFAYSLSSAEWQSRASLPFTPVRLVGLGNALYALEDGDGSHANRFFRYDEGVDAWSTLADAPTTELSPLVTVATSDGRIFGLGNNAQTYDIASNTWTLGSSEPQPRFTPTLVFKDPSTIYTFGGVSDGGAGTLNEVFDTNALSWSIEAPAPIPLNYGSIAVVGCDGLVYVFGGAMPDGVTNFPQYTVRFDPAAQTWDTSP
jgi:hypothetical protein